MARRGALQSLPSESTSQQNLPSESPSYQSLRSGSLWEPGSDDTAETRGTTRPSRYAIFQDTRTLLNSFSTRQGGATDEMIKSSMPPPYGTRKNNEQHRFSDSGEDTHMQSEAAPEGATSDLLPQPLRSRIDHTQNHEPAVDETGSDMQEIEESPLL